MIKVSKYEFDSESQAESKINALSENHKHTIVKLGNIVKQQGVYDEDGNETQAPVLSNKYHVDVLWKDIQEVDGDGNVSFSHPYGWATYAIDLDDEGMHGFMGVSYIENKL
jgi:hypothetical protein